jgi:hypothetical protein
MRTTLTSVAPVGGYGIVRTLLAPSIGAPGPASPTSGCICTRRLCTAQMYTRAGRRELAREWRVETDWEMKEPKQPKPAPAQNGTASGNEEAAVA